MGLAVALTVAALSYEVYWAEKHAHDAPKAGDIYDQGSALSARCWRVRIDCGFGECSETIACATTTRRQVPISAEPSLLPSNLPTSAPADLVGSGWQWTDGSIRVGQGCPCAKFQVRDGIVYCDRSEDSIGEVRAGPAVLCRNGQCPPITSNAIPVAH